MNVLVLNGSPRPQGDTAGMVSAFKAAAESAGHQVTVYSVCRMNIHGCLACEYCHGKGRGACIQKDDMQQIAAALQEMTGRDCLIVEANEMLCRSTAEAIEHLLPGRTAILPPRDVTFLRTAAALELA